MRLKIIKSGSILNSPGSINAGQWNAVIEQIQNAAKKQK